MITLKVTRIGDSVGVILPEEALAQLGVSAGDSLCLTDDPRGGLRISAVDPEVAREIALGEKIMDEYGDTFRALAK